MVATSFISPAEVNLQLLPYNLTLRVPEGLPHLIFLDASFSGLGDGLLEHLTYQSRLTRWLADAAAAERKQQKRQRGEIQARHSYLVQLEALPALIPVERFHARKLCIAVHVQHRP